MELRKKFIELTKEDGRQLVSIRRVDDVVPIPGADRIVTAMVGGWPVVVKKGEFNPGELGVFFEVDSLLNPDDPRFSFLADSKINWKGIDGIRLRTIRLRKQLSQGLLLPLNLFPEIATESADGTSWLIKRPDNAEVTINISKYPNDLSEEYQTIKALNFTETLGVIKWEKIEPVDNRGAFLAGRPAGNFPSYISKSDQTRCQNLNQEIFGYDVREVPMHKNDVERMPKESIEMLLQNGSAKMIGDTLVRIFPPTADPNEVYEVSVKLDGSSMTAYCIMQKDENGDLYKKTGVCSRNLELKTEDGENSGNTFVSVFNKSVKPVLELDHGFGDIALQGELMGPGIQGNREGLSEHEFYVYNIFDIGQQEYMLPAQRKQVLNALNEMAAEAGLDIVIKHVPVLYDGATLGELGITNMQELLKFAEGKSLNPDVDREGLVFKSLNRQFQFKAISNTWLEKNQ